MEQNTEPHRLLRDRGVPFEEIMLDLSLIDWRLSEGNQARPTDAVIAHIIEEYASDYRKGDDFPPLIVRRRTAANGKVFYIIVGGNHRGRAAMKAGLTEHAALVIDVSDEEARIVSYLDNKSHGVRTTAAQRLDQAKRLVAEGMSAAAAAALLGISQTAVNTAVAAERSRERAQSLGMNLRRIARLREGDWYRLAAVKLDPVFLEAANVAVNRMMTAEAIRQLVAAIKAESTPEGQMAVVRAAAATAEEATPAPPGPPRSLSPSTRVNLTADNLVKITEDMMADHVETLTAEERDHLVESITVSRARLDLFAAILARYSGPHRMSGDSA